jgi:hypothetical protein
MRNRLIKASLAACFGIVLASSVALAAENWVGTWKLNTARSKFSPRPGPQSQTLKWEKTAEGIKLSSDTVDADGKTVHGSYVSKFDGKDVPWEGNPNADTASPKKVDDNTFLNGWKMAGKATITTKGRVSKDGKTLTLSQTGRSVKGETVHSIVVYDKQ